MGVSVLGRYTVRLPGASRQASLLARHSPPVPCTGIATDAPLSGCDWAALAVSLVATEHHRGKCRLF